MRQNTELKNKQTWSICFHKFSCDGQNEWWLFHQSHFRGSSNFNTHTKKTKLLFSFHDRRGDITIEYAIVCVHCKVKCRNLLTIQQWSVDFEAWEARVEVVVDCVKAFDEGSVIWSQWVHHLHLISCVNKHLLQTGMSFLQARSAESKHHVYTPSPSWASPLQATCPCSG